jgi:hypothetical protein
LSSAVVVAAASVAEEAQVDLSLEHRCRSQLETLIRLL